MKPLLLDTPAVCARLHVESEAITAALIVLVVTHAMCLILLRRGLTYYLARLFDVLEAMQRASVSCAVPVFRRWRRQLVVELTAIQNEVR